MIWQVGVAIVVMILNLGVRTFLVLQDPYFWIEFD